MNAIGFTWAQCANDLYKCAVSKFYTFNREMHDKERERDNFADLLNLIREDDELSCPAFNNQQMRTVECRPYLPAGTTIKH